MSKHVVIVTHSMDNASVAQVSDNLRDQGLTPVRFNTDKYPTDFLLEAEFSEGQTRHTLVTPSGHTVTRDQIHSVWYRRFFAGKDIDSDMDAQKRSACIEESKRCILGFLSCTRSFQVDDYWKVKQASNKDWQLQLATEVGLPPPATLVTNCAESVEGFYRAHKGKIITKMQTAFSVWQDGVEGVVFTSEVEDHHLGQLDGLRQCPMVFQQNVAKQLELRATIVGNQVFCAAVDSMAHDNMGTDWRKRGSDTLDQWFKYDLPEDIQQKLLNLARKLGLQYGAADIILTPDNQYIFLEINPCGEFYWMDHYTGLGISRAIAGLLSQR